MEPAFLSLNQILSIGPRVKSPRKDLNEMDSFFQNPPTYERTLKECSKIKLQNPHVKLFPIGKSFLGRKIYALALGNMKNCTLFAGAFHAQEWLTCSLLLRFFNDLSLAHLNNKPLLEIDVRKAMEERGIICVPVVNPDGVEIALQGTKSAKHMQRYIENIMRKCPKKWQANARGVDLNHNYDAGFTVLQEMERSQGITGPWPTQYGGKQPNSEFETRAMINLCKTFDIKKVFAFHSQGEEIFYEYGTHTPPASKLIAELLANTCGYQLVQNDGLASHGGFKDWFIEKTHRPGFTIEIGRGENPLPIEDLEPIYARLLEMMLLAVMV